MTLTALILIPLIGGVLAWAFERAGGRIPRVIALATLIVEFLLALALWPGNPLEATGGGTRWVYETQAEWIPQFGISFHLGMDGLSYLLILLTAFLGLMAIGSSWKEITERTGFYYFNLLWILGGIAGIFLALDLFLFYFFWELMLVPMYFLIAIWGHENRRYAALKFFLFTQAGGLLMLLSILGLYFAHGKATGDYTFDYEELLNTPLSARTGLWLMLGFLMAFAVKLPAFPFHPWLADAHTEAPTAGSVILAGLLLKTGAYGILRFVLPIFPEAAATFAPVAMTAGVLGIIYGAILAFAQDDIKRLVAYTSVSHMGFVMVGAFALNELAVQGVVIQVIAHGISTGALFMIVGFLYERIHTRSMAKMGGLWTVAPGLSGVAMLFAMASLGLPGLGNFIAEFLILVGAFQANATIAVLATIGLIFATIYSLILVQRVFHGPPPKRWSFPDLAPREIVMMAGMIIVIIWIGIFPQPVLDQTKGVVEGMLASPEGSELAERQSAATLKRDAGGDS